VNCYVLAGVGAYEVTTERVCAVGILVVNCYVLAGVGAYEVTSNAALHASASASACTHGDR
jgi:hypothetical protein